MEAGEIASLCYERFQELPRTGKPEAGREWTLLAAVVQAYCIETMYCDTFDTQLMVKEVVSLGTGSKCIGQASMSPTGMSPPLHPHILPLTHLILCMCCTWDRIDNIADRVVWQVPDGGAAAGPLWPRQHSVGAGPRSPGGAL
uniref:Adenosine deaminase tRNA specific 1 n=1 Tax=Neogobius melanostomus TaxID=47308 RepID=A0A8C6U5X8_9GOBI